MEKLALSLVLLCATILCLMACSPVTVLNALGESGSSRKFTGIPYGIDPRQQLDVYVPLDDALVRPVVLFFFGGSWNSGNRGDYQFVGDALAAKGFVVVIADYRLYPQVRYPDFLFDSAQAAAWTFGHLGDYGGDAKRVYVMGHSAGAYNAAMLALDPRWLASRKSLAGLIGLAGPYDFLPVVNPDVRPVFFYPDSPADSQPILYADAHAPRSFLAAPENDRVVNPDRNTGQLAGKLRAEGVPVTYKRYSGVTHVTLIGALGRPLRWLAPVLDDITAFIHEDGKK
jgi:acetyl esterase/lipase